VHDPSQTPSTQATEQPQPASLLLRGIALVLDMVILFILAVVIIGMDEVETRTGLAFYLIGWSVYYIGFTAVLSATPGKVAMGLHVADKTGSRARLDSVILRYVVLMAGALPFGIGTIVSIGLVLTDPQRRALHDRIAGTLVLDGRPPLEEWRAQEERDRGRG
jgi:uncharacterized RDD family membrane protein YckC